MSVLLGQVTYTVWSPTRAADAHGWAQEGDVEVTGSVTGCIQETIPVADPSYTGSGSGPNKPAVMFDGTAYLNSEVRAGDRVGVPGGDLWLVRRAYKSVDFTGAGLDCWVADLSRVVNR